MDYSYVESTLFNESGENFFSFGRHMFLVLELFQFTVGTVSVHAWSKLLIVCGVRMREGLLS